MKSLLFQRSSCVGWSGRRERVEEDNVLLYVGLGMSAVGLAVTFVGKNWSGREGRRVMMTLTLGM